MNATTWLHANQQKLTEAGIGTARLDCLVLLEDATKRDRSWLLAHPEYVLDKQVVVVLSTQIEQRSKHVPLAQIRQKTEFFGREFIVTADVLEPRPESEVMITLLRSLSLPAAPRIVDVGSGSGAIGITAALELIDAHVDLLDIDENALNVTKLNIQKHQISAQCFVSDLLTDTLGVYDVILANLPYVPDEYPINTAATHEPRLAIFGGSDGLDVYRRLFQQLAQGAHYVPLVLTESLPFQHPALEKIAKAANYRLQQTEDFIQVFAYE